MAITRGARSERHQRRAARHSFQVEYRPALSSSVEALWYENQGPAIFATFEALAESIGEISRLWFYGKGPGKRTSKLP